MSSEYAQETARELCEYLKDQGAQLRVDNERLVINAPENVITDALAAKIRSAKNDILSLIGRDQDTIEAADRSAPVPLTLFQERMWVHAELEPDSLLYNLPGAWRLSGRLHPEILVDAFDRLVDLHEVLRLQVKHDDGVPYQTFQAPVPELTTIDLTAIADDAERTAELNRQIETIRCHRFDLERGPLMLARLFILGPASHVLFLMPHHLIWDGWCFDVFLKQLSGMYTQLQDPSSKPGVSAVRSDIQYADYAVWYRRRGQERRWQTDLDYWAQSLNPLPDPPALPTDLPRPREFSDEGDWVTFQLGNANLAALRRLAVEHRATPFTVMLTIWRAFLAQITGSDDLVIEAPVQTRTNHQIADAIGCFGNSIFLRSVVDVSKPLTALVDEEKQHTFKGFEHQEAPSDLLAEHVVMDRDPSRNPISQVVFSHQQISERPTFFGEARLEQHHVNTHTTPTDLMLAVMEGKDSATVNLHYATTLFSRPQIETFAASFTTFLTAALAAPAIAVDQHALVEEETWRSLSRRINDTEAAFPSDKTIDQLIALNVEAHADKIAVSEGDQALSYQELWDQSTRIASYLVGLRLPPGVIIGVMMDRTPQMVATILAIWRAGAAYLPLDIMMSASRLQFMMDDSGVELVMTDSESMPDEHDGRQRFQDVALIADTAPDLAGIDQIAHQSTDRAYILYTSGSTGQPKGVVNNHRMVVNFLCSMMKTPGLTSDDRMLAITTLSFDISVLELFGPLAAGGTVVLCSAEDSTDGFLLADLLTEQDITVMQATPISWQLLLDCDWPGQKDLKALCGGEALSPKLVRELLPRVGEFWNMYGPTETTIWSTCRQITSDDDITAGLPIDNTQIYILDAQMRPLPQGLPGEIWIGGDGVATGYLGRKALTQEKFVPDPFREDPQARLYRTGDMGRILANDDLVILGRQDHQVKLRGYRIELGDIEAVLEKHPAISRVVAAIPTDLSGEPVLTAYIVLAGDTQITNSDLRHWLRDRVPSYMIPQAVVTLEAMPLTANGKVNRKALPLPEIAAPAARERIAPRNETEQALAEIWQEILSVDDISVNDNFFELGGQSIQAAQVVARMRRRAGQKIPLRAVIFETLGQLAASSTPA